MSRFALCLALLCVGVQSARALQLGETREQLLARHGAPGAEDHGRNLAVYFWEGWSAQVEFQENVVRKLTYRRNWYLQETEITSLLDANGGAAHWRETSAPNGLARQWTREDGASATCGRVRPVSIVFQAAGLAAAYQQGPTVVVPATPAPAAPAYTKAPTYPQMLGRVVEPELPVADPPPLPTPSAAEPRSLPKLPTAELEPETKPAPVPVVPEPRSERASEKKAAIEPPPAAATNGSHALAYILGSLVLLGALAAGAFYLFRRQARAGQSPTTKVQARDADGTVPSSTSGLDSLRNDQVELLVGEIFRREGYTIELSAGLNTDDGIDLMLRRDSETTLVQCKHWKTVRVSSREMRDFYGAMAAGGAPHGILVTTGTFSPDASEFAEGKGIQLLDGSALAAKIAVVAKPGENLCIVSTWIDDFVAHARVFDPECPVCHGTMVIRHNRANGVPSWNCRGYPRCPGRREPRLDLLPSSAPH
ncbi:MAG: restriction endonuclease [Chthoniobacter sp.]|uniref:restriction endonuclease n=1 Tax=Chthoniobacter sp. TaxID=2510640 RepID=UPI0032AAA603